MCAYMCVCVSCSAGVRQGGKECVWLHYSWTSEDCVRTRDTWQPLVIQQRQNPAEPISAMETDRESHLFSDIMTHALFALAAVAAHAMRLRMKISPQCEQRVPVEVRGGHRRVCCMCVWSCDTVIYYSWTLYLDSLSILHFWTREASILDGWGSDIQTLLLAAYGKSPSLPGSLPRADCHHPNPHPSSTPVTPQPVWLGLAAITLGKILSRVQRH